MSTESPWRSPQVRAAAESPPVAEELESPPRRWPVTLFVVVALLAGLGLGRLAFGGAADELERARGQVESLSTELDTATTSAGRFERRLVRAVDSLEGVKADRHQLVVALVRAFDAEPEAFAYAAPLVTAAAPQTQRLIARAYSAPAKGDLAIFTDLLTEDAVLGVYDAQKPAAAWEYDGFERVVAGMSSLWPLNPRIRGRMVQSGDLVWVRYVETDTRGVTVFRVVDDRIARMWIVMTGPGDGRR